MNDDLKEKVIKMKARHISIETASKELDALLDEYEWFYTTLVEGSSLCAYVSYMNKDVMEMVPMSLYGYQVKIGNKGYLDCDKYSKKFPSGDILELLESMD